jgi:hypothetical protein
VFNGSASNEVSSQPLVFQNHTARITTVIPPEEQTRNARIEIQLKYWPLGNASMAFVRRFVFEVHPQYRNNGKILEDDEVSADTSP